MPMLASPQPLPQKQSNKHYDFSDQPQSHAQTMGQPQQPSNNTLDMAGGDQKPRVKGHRRGPKKTNSRLSGAS